MKDEIYVWIAIVVAIVSVAVYLRILYQPPISLSLSSSAILPSRLYPFEVVKLPVTVSNTGSIGIENLGIGIFVNGRLDSIYRVTLPPGKQVSFAYNFSAISPGNYSIEIIADPAKLYPISDRSAAKLSFKKRSFTCTLARMPLPNT